MNYLYPLFIILFFGYHALAQEIPSAVELLNRGDESRGKEIFEERITKNPKDWEAIGLLGDIFSFEKKWDEAIFLYKKLLTHDPKNPEYNFKCGGALGLKALNVPKLKAVIYISNIKKHLENAAKLDPYHIKSRRALVELYTKLPGILGGSDEKAKMYSSQLMKIDVIEATLAEVFIHKERNEEKEARTKYREVLVKNITPYSNPQKYYLNYELGAISAEQSLEPVKGIEFLESYIDNYSYRDLHAME